MTNCCCCGCDYKGGVQKGKGGGRGRRRTKGRGGEERPYDQDLGEQDLLQKAFLFKGEMGGKNKRERKKEDRGKKGEGNLKYGDNFLHKWEYENTQFAQFLFFLKRGRGLVYCCFWLIEIILIIITFNLLMS